MVTFDSPTGRSRAVGTQIVRASAGSPNRSATAAGPASNRSAREPAGSTREQAGRTREPAGSTRQGAAGARPPARTGLPALDPTDRAILELLAQDARMPNNALAAAVGIAPSTCLGRVRALRAGGAIRGFHADIDPAVLGRPLQAMISVRLQAGARSRMTAFTDRIRSLPEVLDTYFLAGADDFLLHVAAADAAALRDFVVDQLSAHPEVALTETNLIFEHLRGDAPS